MKTTHDELREAQAQLAQYQQAAAAWQMEAAKYKSRARNWARMHRELRFKVEALEAEKPAKALEVHKELVSQVKPTLDPGLASAAAGVAAAQGGGTNPTGTFQPEPLGRAYRAVSRGYDGAKAQADYFAKMKAEGLI